MAKAATRARPVKWFPMPHVRRGAVGRITGQSGGRWRAACGHRVDADRPRSGRSGPVAAGERSQRRRAAVRAGRAVRRPRARAGTGNVTNIRAATPTCMSQVATTHVVRIRCRRGGRPGHPARGRGSRAPAAGRSRRAARARCRSASWASRGGRPARRWPRRGCGASRRRSSRRRPPQLGHAGHDVGADEHEGGETQGTAVGGRGGSPGRRRPTAKASALWANPTMRTWRTCRVSSQMI